MHRRQFLQTAVAATGAACLSNRLAWSAVSGNIPWHNDLRVAHTAAVEFNRPVLIVFSAKWCTFCHKLIREVGDDKTTAKFINARFIPTILDFDRDERIAKVFEIESLPTTVVLSPRVDLLLQKPGYMKPEVFRKTLEATLADADLPIRQVNADAKR